jgi:hypothetical protein
MEFFARGPFPARAAFRDVKVAGDGNWAARAQTSTVAVLTAWSSFPGDLV